MIVLVQALAALTQVGQLEKDYGISGGAEFRTVYLLCDRWTMRGFFAEYAGLAFDRRSSRAQVAGADFAAGRPRCDLGALADGCYVDVQPIARGAAALEAFMGGELRAAVADAPTRVVLTYRAPAAAAPAGAAAVRNMFATGLLWTSILLVLVLLAYMLLSAAPSLLVEEPMAIPRGEEEN